MAINILNVVNKKITKQTLNDEEEKTESAAKRDFTSVKPSGAFSMTMTDMRKMLSTTMGELVNNTPTTAQNIVDRCFVYDSVFSNMKIPYIDNLNASWNYPIEDNPTLKTNLLTPHRLTCSVDVDAVIVKSDYTQNLSDQIVRNIYNAMLSKLVETMFSDNSNAEDFKPKGLLDAANIFQVMDKETLLDFISKGEELSDDMVLIVSPQFKRQISKYINIENNTVNGVELITTNLMQAKHAAMVDLRFINVVFFGIVDLTYDDVTGIKDGLVKILVDFFCDYDIKPNSIVCGSI